MGFVQLSYSLGYREINFVGNVEEFWAISGPWRWGSCMYIGAAAHREWEVHAE